MPVTHRSRETYQSLSHRFVLASNDAALARRASSLIGGFAQPLADASEAESDANGRAEPLVYSLLVARGADGQPSYSLHRGDEEVSVSGDPGVVIDQLFWRISGDVVELAEGYLLVHAGAVVTPGGAGVLILGESGSGKTTLVAALVQEGFGYLSDEAGALALQTGLAHPWPRPLGFKQGARSLERFLPIFAPALAGARGMSSPAAEIHVAVERIRPRAIAAPSRVRYVLDYSYRPGAATRLEPLSRATALATMGSATPRLRYEGQRGLHMLAGLMRGASAHKLVSGDLEQGVRAVCELVKR